MEDEQTSFTIVIVALLSILLLLIATIVFFLVSNTGPVTNIAITNDAHRDLSISGLDAQPSIVSAGTTRTWELTGVTTLNIRASYTNAFPDGGTTVILRVNPMDNGIDEYGVSVATGFNLAATVTSVSGCTGPTWNFVPGVTGSGLRTCPEDLQRGDVCNSPCTEFSNVTYCCSADGACEGTGCQNTWGSQIRYWDLLYAACPMCMITNCDTTNYRCPGAGAYNIRFWDS